MNRESFVETALTANNVNIHYEFIDRLAIQNPFELLEIFQELLHKHEFASSWQSRAIRERIIEAVCLSPGDQQLLAAVSLYNVEDSELSKRKIASYLASNQITPNLIDVILQKRNEIDSYFVELVANELVCRGNDLRNYFKFHEFVTDITSKSMFKCLPLFPLTIESDLPLRATKIGSSGYPIPFGLHNEPFEKLELKLRSIRQFKESPDISLPVRNWSDHSNGSWISLKGSAETQLSPKLLLEELDFEALYAKLCKVKTITANQAFQILFAACANGGAYTSGEYGAIARLYTWKGMNAMVSEEELTDAIETQQKVFGYRWSEFVVDTWFINEWLDLGLVGIGPNLRDFSILAATDTD